LKYCRYVCMYVPLLIEWRVFFSRYIPHPMIVSQIFALLGLYKAAHFRQEWPYVVPIHITMYLIHMLQVGILSSLIIYIHTNLHREVIHTYIHTFVTGFIFIYIFFLRNWQYCLCVITGRVQLLQAIPWPNHHHHHYYYPGIDPIHVLKPSWYLG
jgi:hypothetical protein